MVDLLVVFVGVVIVVVTLGDRGFVPYLAAEVVQLAYLVAMVGARGQTLGMMAAGVRLHDAVTGSTSIGYPKAFVRALVAVLISLPAAFVHFGIIFPLLNYLWPVRDARNQTWHDKAAGTVAVKV